MLELNKVYLGDCLELMQELDDESIDMVLCDLPYGTTKCKWDVVIPFEDLWKHYYRIVKPQGAIVLHCTQPFTSLLITSNLKDFKYCWVWDKVTARGHLVAKHRPMQQTEDIAVFGNGKISYFPIMKERDKPIKGKECKRTDIMGGISHGYTKVYTHSYPKNLLTFSGAKGKKEHPTQKPVPLTEYLIKTYTQPNEIVLDNCAGSGTVGEACLNLNRHYILIEKDPKYFEICNHRLGYYNECGKEPVDYTQKQPLD